MRNGTTFSTDAGGLLSRRHMLRIGGLAPLGLTLPSLLGASQTAAGSRGSTFGRAKRCLMLYMWGGPAHQDTFDLKPHAVSEYRGEFQPIPTNVPGIDICEHFSALSRHADKMHLIRSVTHSDNNHSTSAHWMLTGFKHSRSAENFGASQSDFPHIGSVLSKFAPNPTLPTFVALPELIATTAGAVTPGQGGGILGKKYDPFRIDQHPDEPDFEVPNLTLPDGIARQRQSTRLSLLEDFDQMRRDLDHAIAQPELTAFQRQAIELISSPAAYKAFDLQAESEEMRSRYGSGTFGQSLLLARRLLESGVKLVTVYWHRDQPGVDTTWDTHSENFKGLKNRLIPQVDQPIAALMEDLQLRGLLDDTLVFWNSEFGRTPKINARAGRDHWGKCNTVWMAGGGVRGGGVYGASDKFGSAPEENPVSPADLSATVYHLLGLAPETTIHDQLDRPFPISDGRVLKSILA